MRPRKYQKPFMVSIYGQQKKRETKGLSDPQCSPAFEMREGEAQFKITDLCLVALLA